MGSHEGQQTWASGMGESQAAVDFAAPRAEHAVPPYDRLVSELIELSPFGMYLVDADFRIAVMNRRSQDGAFRNVRPVIGRSFEEALHILWPPQTAEEVLAIFRHTMETGEPYHSREFVHERADIDQVEGYEWEVHRVTTPDGRFGVACYYFDSTHLRAGQAALQERETRFRNLADQAPVFIWMSDPAGRSVWVNRTMLEYSGAASTDEFARLARHRYFLESEGPDGSEAYRAAMAERREFTSERHCWHEASQSYRMVQWQGVPRFEGDEFLGYMGVGIDIHDQREAEQKLRSTTELLQAVNANILDMIFMKDRDGRLLYANPEVSKVLGVPADQLIGMNEAQFAKDPAEAAEIQANDRRIMESGVAEEIEEIFSGPLGTRCYSSKKMPLFDDQGQVVGLIGIARDVTELKAAAQSLEKANDENQRQRLLLERLVDTAPVVIAVVRGPELEFVLVNEALRNIQGTAEEPAVGKRFAECFPDPFVSGAAEGILRVMETGEPWKVRDFQMTGENQEQRWWDGEVVALSGQPFGENGALIIAWETTEAKRAEQQLREATSAAESANRALRISDERKDTFLAMLGHELRNPLAAIVNAAQLLHSVGSPEPLPDSAEQIISRQALYMTRLVDDLLDLSRINRGKLSLNKRLINLEQALELALETSRPLIDLNRHRLSVDLSCAPIMVEGDLTRLAQTISNLLNNAARYSPPETEIQLRARREGDEVIIEVEDRGLGIPADRLQDIFEIFSQVARPHERRTGGLGIGLSLVRTLIELHGGRVSAASEGDGLGSTFTIVLPAAEAPEGAPGKRQPSPPNRLAVRKVLVVDDNCDVAQMVGMLLSHLGHTVRVANSGEEAIGMMREETPDCVFLDIGMPGMNGHEVCQWIRRQPWGEGVKVFAVTGWGQEADIDISRRMGFTDHLVKPVDLARLIRVFESD